MGRFRLGGRVDGAGGDVGFICEFFYVDRVAGVEIRVAWDETE